MTAAAPILIGRLLEHRRRLASHLRDSLMTSRCQTQEIRRQAEEIRHLRGAIERVTLGKSAEILRVQEENEHLREELHQLQAAALRAVQGYEQVASEALGEAYRATIEAHAPVPFHRRVGNWLRSLKRF